jgi:hypothetical protein
MKYKIPLSRKWIGIYNLFVTALYIKKKEGVSFLILSLLYRKKSEIYEKVIEKFIAHRISMAALPVMMLINM